MTEREGLDPGRLLQLPVPLDVVAREHADPVLQAAADELAVLRLELAEVDDELGSARQRAQALGTDPEVLASARRRLDDLVATVVAEAEPHAASITAQATQAGAALVQRAQAHAQVLRAGAEPDPTLMPTTTIPVVAPVAPVAPMPWTPVPVSQPTPMAPPGWTLVPEAHGQREPRPEAGAPTPYAKTVGLLQVVTWSVLVAAVLIVLLAWFA